MRIRLTVKADKIDEFKKTAEELVRKTSEEEEKFYSPYLRHQIRAVFIEKT